VFAQFPVPIVVSRGALVPVAVFALIFMALSGVSGAGALATVAVIGGLGGVLSLIVHELGHVSVARRLSGVRPEKVAVMSLGAAAHFDGSYRNGREQVRMALGGPEASLAFALALGVPVFLPAPFLLKVALLGLALLNIAIAALSLLPFHPLDGHKLVVGLVWWAVGSEEDAKQLIKRIGVGLIALDFAVAVVLLAARPLMGVTVTALAAVALVQKRFVGRLKPPNE
jgi:Zn-dependent protease